VCYHTPQATDPDNDARARHKLSLFGFAPDGVYLARDVTIAAVRSYRTLSAFPSAFFAKYNG